MKCNLFILTFHFQRVVEISRVLGRGAGFCVVNQIDKVTLLKDGKASIANFNDEDVAQLVQDRNFMATYCIRKGKDPRYAIKQLSDDIVLQDPHNYINGLMDQSSGCRDTL